MSKIIRIFQISFFIEAYCFMGTLFDKVNFQTSLFSEMTSNVSRLQNLLRGWLLVLSIKECLVECVTMCVKSDFLLIIRSVVCSNSSNCIVE